MPKYVVQWKYSSSRGSWAKGDVTDMREAQAAEINIDSPGVLVLWVEPQPDPPAETRDEEAPPHDRLQRGKGRR